MHRRQFLAAGATTLVTSCGRPPADVSPNEEADVDDEAQSSLEEEYEAMAAESVPGVGGAIDARRFPDEATARATIFTDPFIDAEWRAPPLTPELQDLVRTTRYWSVPSAQRPAPRWAEAARAPDYGHLDDFARPAEEFEISAETLQFLAERNAFHFRDQRPVRIFGLRGASLSSGEEASWGRSHAIRIDVPDHLSCKCLLGVWRPQSGEIALFRASTAPAVSNMFKSLRTQGAGTSLLPTGLYRYRSGPHKRRSPTAIQRGALLIEGEYVVLRTPDDLSYDPFQADDVWTRGAAHNIHSAGVWSRPNVFDSSGCQVVRGSYTPDRLRTDGPWSTFQQAAGLMDANGAPAPIEEPGSGSYDYMLLTGLEAGLYAAQNSEFLASYRRLRPGSSGDEVRAEKARLRASVQSAHMTSNDRFDMWMSFAVLVEQKQRTGEYVSPVVAI